MLAEVVASTRLAHDAKFEEGRVVPQALQATSADMRLEHRAL